MKRNIIVLFALFCISFVLFADESSKAFDQRIFVLTTQTQPIMIQLAKTLQEYNAVYWFEVYTPSDTGVDPIQMAVLAQPVWLHVLESVSKNPDAMIPDVPEIKRTVPSEGYVDVAAGLMDRFKKVLEAQIKHGLVAVKSIDPWSGPNKSFTYQLTGDQHILEVLEFLGDGYRVPRYQATIKANPKNIVLLRVVLEMLLIGCKRLQEASRLT